MCRVGLIGGNSVEYVDKLIDIWNSGNCAVLIDFQIPIKTAVVIYFNENVSFNSVVMPDENPQNH